MMKKDVIPSYFHIKKSYCNDREHGVFHIVKFDFNNDEIYFNYEDLDETYHNDYHIQLDDKDIHVVHDYMDDNSVAIHDTKWSEYLLWEAWDNGTIQVEEQ